jgi:hypothetical protein
MRVECPHNLMTILVMLLILCGNAHAKMPGPPQAQDPAAAAPGSIALNACWAQVLDKNVPIAERRRALSQIEQEAQTGDQHDLYVLGSLYHMGQHATGSLVQQDLARASLYLGNAATRGSVLAMAKMAEIKLATQQYREAMNWAQIYGHYALLLPKGDRPHDGYAAELVQRIIDRLGKSAMPEVMGDVNSFIASHDADIRAGTDSRFTGKVLHPAPKSSPYIAPSGRIAPHAGFADYLIAFNADGSVANAWLLDAVPVPDLGLTLRKYAWEMRMAPTKAPNGEALRYAWMPVLYDDGRYRVALTHP